MRKSSVFYHIFHYMKLTIVRHWESETNLSGKLAWHYDTPLTTQWVIEAKTTADILKNDEYDIAFTSDLQRAQNTAIEILNYHENVELIVDQLLRERDFWKMSWRLKADIANELWIEKAEIYNKMSELWISESDESLRARAREFLEILMSKYSDKSILLINHWWLMRGIMTEILEQDRMKTNYLNCSITKLEFSSLPWKVIIENDVTHL